ncbi:MAG: bi-domain-containing oxidoreductase [Candidatus Hydrogenedentes bacterium]|nr:bi-domain-containing oxidoreductase [Candidatus Hydrogenedentota bacterium]
MKQVINIKGAISVAEVPEPACGAGEVKIAVTHSLISSGTETYTIAQTGQNLLARAKDRPDLVKKVWDRVKTQGVSAAISAVQEKVNEPKPMGYSAAGIVVEVGNEVTRFAPGDRVACGGSSASHAEIACVPENLVVRAPDSVEPQHACFATLGAIALQGARRAQIELGDNVVVLGLGLVGQLAIQFAKAAGARVLGFDLAQDRADLTKELGADEAHASGAVNSLERVLEFTGGVGADAVIVAAATKSSQPVNDAIAMARMRGRISILGIVGLELEYHAFYAKELDVFMSRSYGPGRYDVNYEGRGLDYPISHVRWTENRNMGAVLRMIADGRLDVAPLISEVVPIGDAERAYAQLQSGETRPLGIVLEYPTPTKRKVPPPSAPTAPRRGARNVTRIAVIGCGGFAKKERLPYLHKMPGFEIGMLISRSGPKVKQLAEHYGVVNYGTEYEEALNRSDIDLVLIATPNSLHAPIALAAAKSGKDVIVEKPMAVNRRELDDLYAALQQHPVRFACAFNRRFAPASIGLKQFADACAGPKSVVYRCNAGLLPPGHFMHPPEEGGGLVVGEACHFYDYCAWLIGSVAVNVASASVSYEGQQFVGTDNISSVVRFADGSTATVIYTTMGNAKLPKERVEMYAGGACAVVDDYTSLQFYGASGKAWNGAQDKGHRAMLSAIVDAFRADSDLPIGLDASYTSHVLTFAALESARTGAVVSL